VADQVRDLYLEEVSYPQTTSSLSIDPAGSSSPVVELQLLGFVHWLKAYIYTTAQLTTSSSISDKIIDILDYDPNGIISTNYLYVQSNPFLVLDSEQKLRYAWDIISELVSYGGAGDTRRIFGIYENRTAYYGPVPSVIDYQYLLGSRQVITQYGTGTVIRPWAVRPGRWITIPDFLIGRYSGADLRSDPRNKLIEAVRFRAPYSVDLSGGKTDRLSQVLAKITYTGGFY
jgi:hypothetical protein